MGDTAGPGCSKGDGAETGAGMISNVDGPKGVEGKIDITISDKTNKTPILISY